MSTERTGSPVPLPSAGLLLGFVAGVILFAVTVGKGLQDADSFWHVTTGRLIVETGQVPSTDPYSFTYGGQPWTPHEWLSEVVMYLLDRFAGTTGSLVAFGVIIGAIAVVHAAGLERMGLRALAIGPALAVGTTVMFPYATVRPQAISWLLMTVLLWLLLSVRPARTWLLAAIPLLFVAWANLHGLYVVGLGFVAAYAAFTVAGRTTMSARRWSVVGVSLAAVVASMLTPAGPQGILYPLRYIDAGDWGLENIQEWQSPDFQNPAHWPLLGLILALIANGGRAAPGWLVALSWVTVAMALVSLRNAPIAAVVAMPVLAIGIAARIRPTVVHAPSVTRSRRILETAVALVVAIAAVVILVPDDPAAASAEAIRRRYPVAAVDELVATNPDVRVLADYGWSGYVISRLYETGGRVFVDGRNDMYGDELLEQYSTVRAAEDGWDSIVERYGVEALLFPPTAPIVRGFAQDAGWCEALRDDVQVLLIACPAG